MLYRGLSLPLACTVLLAAAPPAEHRISGPYTHDNLSVFLIHGASGAKTNYLPLKAAMEQKKVVVYETKDVNELAIENRSDQDVYIQGGDIVKGGDQDRVLTNDYVLPRHSGKVPISAFCVEHGRWSQRGSEPSKYFGSSTETVATKNMKVAVHADKNQAKVWEEVSKTQVAVSANAVVIAPGVSGVASSVSPSSLQLSLESQPVNAAVNGYVKALSDVVRGKVDVVGMAFAVNGEMNSADVYASPGLFQAMWPKLLKASAVESVRLLQKGKAFPAPTAVAVEALLRDANSGKEATEQVNARVKLVSRDGEKQVMIESRDGGDWVHRNYIKK